MYSESDLLSTPTCGQAEAPVLWEKFFPDTVNGGQLPRSLYMEWAGLQTPLL